MWDRAPEAREAEVSVPSRGPSTLEDGPTCHLATGLLAGVLTRVAGRPVAAMEVLCGRGEIPLCWFLIGDGDRLRRLHVRLRNGTPLRPLLAEIGRDASGRAECDAAVRAAERGQTGAGGDEGGAVDGGSVAGGASETGEEGPPPTAAGGLGP